MSEFFLFITRIETLRIALFPVVFMLVKFFYGLKRGFWSELIFAIFIVACVGLHVYLIVA